MSTNYAAGAEVSDTTEAEARPSGVTGQTTIPCETSRHDYFYYTANAIVADAGHSQTERPTSRSSSSSLQEKMQRLFAAQTSDAQTAPKKVKADYALSLGVSIKDTLKYTNNSVSGGDRDNTDGPVTGGKRPSPTSNRIRANASASAAKLGFAAKLESFLGGGSSKGADITVRIESEVKLPDIQPSLRSPLSLELPEQATTITLEEVTKELLALWEAADVTDGHSSQGTNKGANGILDKTELTFRLDKKKLMELLKMSGIYDKLVGPFLEDVFLDTDGDGQLSTKELLEAMDWDGDGQISKEEFFETLGLKLPEAPELPRSPSLSSDIDVPRSGQ